MKITRRDFIHAGCAAGAVSLSFIDRAKAGLHFHGSETAVTSLALTAIPANKMHQRSASLTTGPVPLIGTFSGGTLSGVEGQILKVSDNSIVKDWTALSGASIGGGAWSGTLAGVAQGGPYYAKVRASNAPAVGATGATGWYMGLLFVGYGQSNMGTFVSAQTAPIPTASAGTVTYDTTLGWCTAGLGQIVGNGAIQFMNDMVATGVPIGMVQGAIAATDIDFLANDSPTDYSGGGGLWRLEQILIAGGITDAEMMLYYQGEGSVARPEVSYLSFLSLMHQRQATFLGRTKAQFPFLLAGLAPYTGAPDPLLTNAGWSVIRTAHFHAAQQQTNMHFSHSDMDAVLADGLHLNGVSQQRGGDRFARTAQNILGLGGGEGHFEITGGTVVDATHTTISVTLIGSATDISPSSGITGFEVTGNNGATWISATGARASATTVTLTHASIATTSVRKVRYQYGLAPDVSAPLRDNSALTLPATYTADNISPTPLSAVPTPLWCGGYRSDTSGLVQSASFAIRPNATQLVIVTIAGRAGSSATPVVTVTPNVGTPITATQVANTADPGAIGADIFQALLLSDANTATQVDVTWTVVSQPFGGNDINVWTIPSASLSSTSATDAQIGSAASANAASVNVNVSAGGFIIAAGATQDPATGDIGTLSGTETFATRYNQPGFSGTCNTAGDASGCAANASSAVTVTFTGAASAINIAAATWR